MPCKPRKIVCNLKEKSKRNGFRCAVFSTHWYPKDKYVGQWKNDKKEGKGIETYRNGYVHKGEWIDNQRQGFGLLSKIKHKECPELLDPLHLGCWCNGKKHGYGLHWYPDRFYKGYFREGKKCGYGQMWWNCGQYYEGFWDDDKFHGKGTLYYTNCNIYEGQFVYGKKHGYGIYYHKNTGQIQYGYWTDDMCTNSNIEDAYFRQSARRPTPFPVTKIPSKLELNKCVDPL